MLRKTFTNELSQKIIFSLWSGIFQMALNKDSRRAEPVPTRLGLAGMIFFL